MRGHLEPAGERHPTEEETAQLVEIEAAIAKRESEVDEDEHDYDDELRALTRKQDAIVSACRVFTAEQKAEHSLIVFIGHDGIEQVAFTRSAKGRSEEHTSELQSLMRISYAGFCLKKKNQNENMSNIRLTDLQLPFKCSRRSGSGSAVRITVTIDQGYHRHRNSGEE